MTTKAYEELDRFEQGMAEHLVKSLRYRQEDAIRMIDEYSPALSLLEKHYNCEDYAERLHEAHANGLTPELWVARIRELERPARGSGKKATASDRLLQ